MTTRVMPGKWRESVAAAPEPQPTDAQRVAVLVVNALGFAGFYLLLPAVPVLATRHGGTVVAGAATATFMAATVATQLLTAELLRRWRMSTLLVVAGLAMGPPTLLYDATSGVVGFFAITVVRGCGFGLLTAVGSAAVMACTTPANRGRQIGLYGLVASLPAVVLPAAGVRLVDGHQMVAFVVCALCGVASSVCALRLRALPDEPGRRPGLIRAMRAGHIRNPSLAFLPFTMGYGAVFTFVPLWHRSESAAVLLMFAIGFTGCRVLLGRHVTESNARLALTGTAAVGGTASLLAAYASSGWLIPLGLLIGSAVGSAATLTLFLLTASTSDAERGASAALWSVAFDGGIGLGALGLAIVADLFGHASVYVVVAACMAAVALLTPPRREAHA